jgi:hypothetical protein
MLAARKQGGKTISGPCYIVFDDAPHDRSLGWTADQIADALRSPLAAIGVRVVRQRATGSTSPGVGFQARGWSRCQYNTKLKLVGNIVNGIMKSHRRDGDRRAEWCGSRRGGHRGRVLERAAVLQVGGDAGRPAGVIANRGLDAGGTGAPWALAWGSGVVVSWPVVRPMVRNSGPLGSAEIPPPSR